jgi:hypothetical protein
MGGTAGFDLTSCKVIQFSYNEEMLMLMEIGMGLLYLFYFVSCLLFGQAV